MANQPPRAGTPFNVAEAYFARLASPDASMPEPEGELLSTIRRALQHHEPPSTILGKLSQVSSDGVTVEELTWGRRNVVSILGGCIQRQWAFPQEHEEIRAVCWANFEEKTSRRTVPKATITTLSPAISNLFQEDATSVFGPYTQKMTQKAHHPTTVYVQGPENGPYGPGTGAMVRAICIIFRSFAQIQLEDGTEHCIHIPFLTRRVWALFPVGFALEQESPPDMPPWASPLDVDPILHSLSAPLRAISPLGVARQIRNTTSGLALVYQEDLPHPNQDPNTFSGLNNGEKVIFVSPYSSSSPQIIFTVDTRTMSIHCYSYAYAPIERAPESLLNTRNVVSEPPSPRGPLFDDNVQLDPAHAFPNPDGIDSTRPQNSTQAASSQWMMENTPPPASWRDSRPHGEDDEFDLNAQLSIVNSVLMDLRDEDDEEVVGPDHWLQRIASVLIDPESTANWGSITVTCFNDVEDLHLASSCAIMLPILGSYRLIHVYWDQQVPLIARSSLIARVDHVTYPARAVVNIRATRKESRDLLVLQPDHSLFLISGSEYYRFAVTYDKAGLLCPKWASDDILPTYWDERGVVMVDDLLQEEGSDVTLVVSSKRHTVSFDLTPQNLLTCNVFDTLHYSLPADQWNLMRRRYLHLWVSKDLPKDTAEELDCLWTVVFEILKYNGPSFQTDRTLSHHQPFNTMASSASHGRLADDAVLFKFRVPQLHSGTTMTSAFTLLPLAAPVLFSLHLLGQSLKVDVTRRNELPLLLRAVLRLSCQIAPEWTDYWSRICPDMDEAWKGLEQGHHTWDSLPVAAPDFVDHCLQGRPWIGLEAIPGMFNSSVADFSVIPASRPCSNLEDLSTFFSIIWRNTRVRDLGLSEELANVMVERNWTLEILDKLPISLALPIREVLKTCQISPRMTYSLETYKLIDREDLFEFVRGASANYDIPTPENDSSETVGSVVHLAARDASGNLEADANSGNLTKDLFTEIRWTEDRRVDEVQLMLQSSRTPVIKIQYTLPPNEHEKENAALVLRISERTLSLPPGRALFTYGCLNTATPEAYVIPKIELSVRVMPLNVVMVLEQAKLTSETKNWAEFHNGAAAGLRLSPQTISVDGSWIQFTKPSELTAEHAGFLYGLGLNGHLKQVDTWNTFSYLSPKHDQTSMALLLGLAASNVGSSSHYITRLIAVHTPALLPIRTIDINVSLLTQSAGLVALGLVFLGTGNRRLAEIALKEISREDIMAHTHGHDNREAYTVSAALAFGMIMVGKGAKTHSVADNIWLNRFRLLIHGDRKVVSQTDLPKNFDLNITAPGACLALALLYLRSGRKDVADIVSVPTTQIALNTVPPNLLLLRTLAKSLILWEDIKPSTDWVNSQFLPMKKLGAGYGVQTDASTVNALDIASYNVIAGACMAMSLKFAGTASADAFKVVVFYYDILIRGVYSNARTYEHSIRRQATRDAINVLSCAMAFIMAGSGDIECLQRFRFAHGKYTTPNKFGMHMANHMAMGLLFLGGGRYTLGNSDAAICSLLASFYPRFPLFGYDNRFHLQALRHIWVLAVEPRCLIPRDVDTRKVVLLPVKIKVTETNGKIGSIQLLAPTLTHDFNAIRSLRVDSPRYLPIYVDYEQAPQFKDAFIRNQTLWVKRRRGYLGYYEDPHCARSSFVRSTGGATGDTACLNIPELLDGHTKSSRDFSEFMISFSDDDRITTFAERLCSDDTRLSSNTDPADMPRLQAERAWVTFCQAALMDCFAADKTAMLPVYMGLHATRVQPPEESSTATSALLDLVGLQGWYRRVKLLRPPLMRPQVVKSVFLVSAGKLDALRQSVDFMGHLRDYVNGRPLKAEDGQPRHVIGRQLAFYLSQSETPPISTLSSLKTLYVETVQAGVARGMTPISLRSALMMVMKETARKALGLEWQWEAILDVIVCWMRG